MPWNASLFYLALVKAGEIVEVTERGELVAVLAPPGASRSASERMLASRRLIPATSPSGRIRSPRPIPTTAGEPTDHEPLDAERAERP